MFQSLTAHFVSTEFRTKQNSLCMKITVNNKETEFDGTSVSDLAAQLQLPEMECHTACRECQRGDNKSRLRRIIF